MKRWKLFVVFVSLLMNLLLILAAAPQGDPLSGIQWQKVDDWKPLLGKGPVKDAGGANIAQPQNKGASEQHGAEKAPPLLNNYPQTPGPQSTAQQSSDDVQKEMLNIQWWMMIFTGALAINGFLQIVLIISQLCIYRRQVGIMETQAGLMEEQADLMKQQADLLRDQNRPWIMVTPDSPEGWPDEGGPSSFIRFRWTAKNVGKSPAFLTGMWTRTAVALLPKGPLEYGKIGELAKFIIPPDGFYEGRKNISPNEPQLADLTASRKCLVFYGVIYYEDTFGNPHETRFCSYWWSGVLLNRNFAHVGPPGTTKYT